MKYRPTDPVTTRTSPTAEFLTPLDSRPLAHDDQVIRFDAGDLFGLPIGPADGQIGSPGLAQTEVQAPVVAE